MDSTDMLTNPAYSFMPGNVWYWSIGPGAWSQNSSSTVTTISPEITLAGELICVGAIVIWLLCILSIWRKR